ncbi:MAG: PP2C family protein-serine/threonine phosphatase [Bacillota bacterium]|nr:PP2C family protein-serine/threonine phosphatase [Bacillota bacterium]
MTNITKNNFWILGLLFALASSVFTILVSNTYFFSDLRLQPYLFDAGVDSVGALICVALYFGCMSQGGKDGKTFRALVIMVSACFSANLAMLFTSDTADYISWNFALCMVSKFLDLFLTFYFYLYIRATLDFKGKLARWAEKGIPILLAAESLIVLSNILYPVTFSVSANGVYQYTETSWIEDIFLLTVSLITTILIVRSKSVLSQKAAALTFLLFPVFMYVFLGGTFGDAAQYGAALMSLIIVYCVIFNYNSGKLAATQTELNMATAIQEGMLPSIFPPFPEKREFDLYASMDPAKEVGGDFYDFFMIDEDHLGVVIADVSGKGIPAALYMMISKTIVQNTATLGIGPAEVLKRTNDSLCSQNTLEMFVTTWVGVLELSTGKLICSNAGHEYPAICRGDKFELLKDKHGFVLGGMEGMSYTEYEIQMHQGDKIFVYTDGVPEATNADHALFGTARMIDALNTNAAANPKEVLNNVRASVDQFVGIAEQFDDLTMLCLEYKGAQA